MEPKSERYNNVLSFLEHIIQDARPNSRVINETKNEGHRGLVSSQVSFLGLIRVIYGATRHDLLIKQRVVNLSGIFWRV
jgi:hypothetical protein